MINNRNDLPPLLDPSPSSGKDEIQQLIADWKALNCGDRTLRLFKERTIRVLESASPVLPSGKDEKTTTETRVGDSQYDPPTAGPLATAAQSDLDARSSEWGLVNVYTISRRRLRCCPESEREWWQHVIRIAEQSGVRRPSVLRHSVPTEITGG